MERLEIIYLSESTSDKPFEEQKEKESNEQKMLAKIQELIKDPIEKAHCFGPDEEFKLRNIMHEIKLDKLKEAFEQIAKALESKRDKSLYDNIREILKSIMSSITTRRSSTYIKPIFGVEGSAE